MTGSGRSFLSLARPAGGLLLLAVAGSLLAAGAGCGGDESGADSPPLEGAEWTLVSGVDAPDDAVPTLLLDAGNASGFGGCNRFAGGYELDGDAISLGPLAGTQMGCPEPQMETEFAYTQALSRPTRGRSRTASSSSRPAAPRSCATSRPRRSRRGEDGRRRSSKRLQIRRKQFRPTPALPCLVPRSRGSGKSRSRPARDRYSWRRPWRPQHAP